MVRSGSVSGEPAGWEHDVSAPGPDQQFSFRDFLAGYDDEVERSLQLALGAESGLERVRALHNVVRPSVVVHDAVLNWALCPLLDELPRGSAVADRLRSGCRERAELLSEFDAISRHVAAHNVYPVSGTEVEEVLEGLERSFSAHIHDETAQVSEVLESAGATADPNAIAVAMSLEARRAPTRHLSTQHRPRSRALLAFERWHDRFDDWSDAHWNWSGAARRSPRIELVQALRDQASSPAPSIAGVLEGFDAAVDSVIDEFHAASEPAAASVAARRVVAAIAIHDSVVCGTLCPLLRNVPGGESAAARLREGCIERGKVQGRLDTLTRRAGVSGADRSFGAEALELVGQLIKGFEEHEREGTAELELLMGSLPDDAFRTRTSAFNDVMWPWHSGGPALLALHMALWAESSPTRSHPRLLRHPSSRALRRYYRLVDHFRDYWGDSGLERWIFPRLPERPFSHGPSGPGAPEHPES